MISNLHTHSKFCDGKNTLEEMVISAIEKGFCSIGFSGHGYTFFDTDYCMTDVDGYINELKILKERYKKEIQIYVGVEEDILSPADRNRFDYIISSSHYLKKGDKYLDIDLGYDNLINNCKLYESNLSLAEDYYKTFCSYIQKRKPDIIGHFDLITKFDEKNPPLFLNDPMYLKLSEKYLFEAMNSDCIFEVNTGGMARGLRISPYPYENLLFALCKNGGKITITSDCHVKENLDFGFKETKLHLKDIGFKDGYILYNNEFKKTHL